MSFLVHFGVGLLFFETATIGVEHLFGSETLSGGHTKRNSSVLRLLRPLVATLVRHAKGLAIVGRVLVLLDVVELIGHAAQVLCLDDLVDVLAGEGFPAVGVGDGELVESLLEAGVHLNLTRVEVISFTELLDVLGGAQVASNFVAVSILAHDHIDVVATSRDDLASSLDAGHGVSPYLCRGGKRC